MSSICFLAFPQCGTFLKQVRVKVYVKSVTYGIACSTMYTEILEGMLVSYIAQVPFHKQFQILDLSHIGLEVTRQRRDSKCKALSSRLGIYKNSVMLV